MNEINTAIHYGDTLAKELKAHKIRFLRENRKDTTIFTLPVEMDNVSTIHVKLIVDNEDGESCIRYSPAYLVPEKLRPAMFMTLNDCNRCYRYVCLSLNDEGSICADHDFTLYEGAKSLYVQAMCKVFRFADSLDCCLPEILQILDTSVDKAIA
ncbi:MAG: YbjN domain-containing protein [Clostridia bacterium]|nr:YbjN domain-containing protein [Clostridia bacterium]